MQWDNEDNVCKIISLEGRQSDNVFVFLMELY